MNPMFARSGLASVIYSPLRFGTLAVVPCACARVLHRCPANATTQLGPFVGNEIAEHAGRSWNPAETVDRANEIPAAEVGPDRLDDEHVVVAEAAASKRIGPNRLAAAVEKHVPVAVGNAQGLLLNQDTALGSSGASAHEFRRLARRRFRRRHCTTGENRKECDSCSS